VTLPITEEVNNVLFENKDPRTAVLDLMLRDRKMELTVSGEDLPDGWK
jgi:glycerol-3-phosphate dehydrogenase (NAD(P)+)